MKMKLLRVYSGPGSKELVGRCVSCSGVLSECVYQLPAVGHKPTADQALSAA